MSDVLVSTQWVDDNLAGASGASIRIVEVDVDTKAYDEGHIPGAVGWNWQTELCDTIRRDIVSKSQLEDLLGGSGVDSDSMIVLYGDNNNWFACWAYWQLEMFGHGSLRIMDGGRKKWLAEGRPLSRDLPAHSKTSYTAADADLSLRAFLPQVMDAAKDLTNWSLVDVRSPDEYSGKVLCPPGLPETCQRGGHIPGAVSIPWGKNCKEDGTFKSPDDLKTLYQDAGIGSDRSVIAYCRIGERSSISWFVLKHLLNFETVLNYDGSWTEWGNLVNAPVERGA